MRRGLWSTSRENRWVLWGRILLDCVQWEKRLRFLCWAAHLKLGCKEIPGPRQRKTIWEDCRTRAHWQWRVIASFFFVREHSNRRSVPACSWQRERAPSMRCNEDGWRAAELWWKLGVGVESAPGSRLTTVAESQGVQIVNRSQGTTKD